jgi:7-cyano-7-deazaguanine synthase
MEKRKSMKYEIRAMGKIRDILSKKKNNANFCILPTKYILRDSIADDQELFHSWKVLHDKYLLGLQYEYLSRFCKQQNLRVEVCIENCERSRCRKTLTGEGKMILSNYMIDNDVLNMGGYLYLDKTCFSSDAYNILGNLIFPEQLYKISKLEEIRLMREWGMDDVVMATWFCHNPVFGMPCGYCNPCRDAFNEDLAWRVPTSGRILGTLRQPFLYVYYQLIRIHHKLQRILGNSNIF